MVVANRGRQYSKTLGMETSRCDESKLGFEFDRLEEQGRRQLTQEGLKLDSLTVRRTVDMRYVGQSYSLNVAWKNRQQAMTDFQLLHQQRYGYTHQVATELVTLRVGVVSENSGFELPELVAPERCNDIDPTTVYADAVKVKGVTKTGLEPGEEVVGPAVISEYSATTFVAPKWSAHRDRFGNLLLERANS